MNVEETTDDANKSDGQVIGSDLSYNIMSATSFSGISSDDLKIPTAQSTGASMDSQTAVAGAGIGMGDVMSLNDTLFGRLPPNDMVASNTNHATDKSNSRPLEGSALGSNSGKSKYSEIINNTNNDIDEKSLKAWLLTEIPKLNQNDIEAYSRGLSKIGFHPECVTVCELKYEEFDFMKVLHQRYLFNEDICSMGLLVLSTPGKYRKAKVTILTMKYQVDTYGSALKVGDNMLH